jgi:ubiquinone biosynthesis protein
VTVLLTLALVVGFAVVVRGMLAARFVSWSRLLLASLIGYVVGASAAALLIIGPIDPESLDGAAARLDSGAVAVTALPFQLLTTMVVVVVMELVRSRPVRRRRLRPLHPVAAVRRRAAITRRGLEVSRVAVGTGLGPLLGLSRGRADVVDPEALARSVREAIEQLGGVFVKLGQLLATRPDLLPPAVVAELGRLHSSVRPVPVEQVRAVLLAEGGLGSVRTLDPEPLGSASIAQVHVARLADGSEVVVKVQRPGLDDVVERDLAILGWLARLAERRTSWGRLYRVRDLADDLADQVSAEMDFRTEARHVTQVAAGLAGEPRIRVPAVLMPATRRTLVTERLRGTPLSQLPAGAAPTPAGEFDGEALADALCASQVRAMLTGARFHGDPHPGNVLLLDAGTLGLVDFGMTGRLDSYGRAFVVQLLAAIRLQDSRLLYEALIAGGSVDADVDRDAVERELAAFMAAHLTSTLPSVGVTTELLRVAMRLGIGVPDQAAVMVRALGTLAGTLEMLRPGYPFVERVADHAGIEVRERLAPASAAELLQREWVDLAPLVRRVPRQLDRITGDLATGRLSARVRLLAHPEDRRVVESLLDKLVVAGIGVGLLATSVAMIAVEAGPAIVTADLTLLAALGWVGLFAGAVLVLRVLLDVLRSPPPV